MNPRATRLIVEPAGLAALAIPVATISWAAMMGSIIYMFASGRELLLAFLVSWLFMMPALFFLLLGVAFPLGAVTAPLGHVAEVTTRIASSERRLGPVVCAGRIGLISYGGPVLRVRVHADGVILHPVFMPAIPLHVRELSLPQRQDGWLYSRLSIPHTSSIVRRPVQLIFFTSRHRDVTFEALRACCTGDASRSPGVAH